MKIKRSFFRYLAYALEIIILFVLQNTPNLMPEIFGSKPLLLLPAAFAIAAFEDTVPAVVFGAVCGVLTDIGSGAIGYFGVMLTLLCFVQTELFRKYFVTSLRTTLVFSFAAITLVVCLYFLLFRLLAGIDSALYLFVHHYISRVLYTFAFTVVLYFLNSFLKKNFTSSR